MKEYVRAVNNALSGDYLVGNRLTLADFAVAYAFIIPFQIQLDGGFRKAMGKVSAWFERVVGNKSIVKTSGKIVPCAKALKPATIKVAPKKAAAPK